jgi:hypothetical protein
MAIPPKPPHREQASSVEVEWTTISYRTIVIYALVVLALVGTVAYFVAPNYFSRKALSLLSVVSDVGKGTPADASVAKKEAHFVNIDGTVRVKKSRSNQWIRADYNTSLEKGDFVQTAGDGVARVIFADGTNYVLKPDSLIIVEESREDPVTRATRVAVQVTSGTVDLATGKFEVAGSTSQVSFADAQASLSEETRAVVQNDPKKDVHEFSVNQGDANVTRGSTSVHLGQYDQVAFKAANPGLEKSKIIAPPQLIDPVNMALTLSKDPRSQNLHFEWSSVPGAVAYHLQISSSPSFANFAVDKKIVGRTSEDVNGLVDSVYYWTVKSIDAKGEESDASPANRFSLVQQAEGGNKAFLEITSITQHGRIVEIQGRTEPGSSVIINNEQVFSIAPDGTFRHFTSPLPRTGENQITITAQNRKGDTNTIRKTVVIE